MANCYKNHPNGVVFALCRDRFGKQRRTNHGFPHPRRVQKLQATSLSPPAHDRFALASTRGTDPQDVGIADVICRKAARRPRCRDHRVILKL